VPDAVDRVITSVSGKIVPAGQISVLQALDPSIIKTIDVHEGEQVQPDSCSLLSTRPLRRPICAGEIADRKPRDAGGA
jgi:hypothetical protein